VATTSAVPAYIYYGHSSLALIIFVAVIVVRLVASQRRRGMGRPSRPTPPQAPGLVGDRPTPPAAAPPSAGPSSGGTAPGWMRDPFFRHEQRYWSGTAWTEHVSDAGVPATDPPPPPR
jgi:hypothetical protein